MSRRPNTEPRLLTRRETEILRALAAGKTPAEVAAEFRVKRAGIEVFRHRIRRKTGLKTPARQLEYASRNNLLYRPIRHPASPAGDLTTPTVDANSGHSTTQEPE